MTTKAVKSAQPSRVKWALWFAENLDCPVFPLHWLTERGCSCGDPKCASAGEHPLIHAALSEATTDAAVINSWWAKHPLANIGIVTGKASDLVVVDLERGAGASLAEFERKHGTLPNTLTVVTGSGSQQRYFLYPTEHALGSMIDVLPGVTVHSDGGYVVGPGSFSRGGKVRFQDTRDIAELPAHFVQLVNATTAAPAGSWEGTLIRSGARNKLQRTTRNALLILEHDERWRGVIGLDLFKQELVLRAPPPFGRPGGGNLWGDSDDTQLQAWLEAEYDLHLAIDTISRVVKVEGERNSFHPIREYLESRTWDGKSRIADWLTRGFGVAESDYVKAVGSKWLIAAVARIFNPGCKADHVLILEGEQGARKSSALSALCGNSSWFVDDLDTVGSKDASAQIGKAWIVEIAELDSIHRSEVSTVKAFITRCVDKYRPAYGRYVIEVPRQCVFAGTINPSVLGYFRDESGNRRFWPVLCTDTDIAWIEANRDQLWAEATAKYRARETWWLDQRQEAEARSEQESRLVRDEWSEAVDDWLVGKDEVTVGEVLDKALGLEKSKWGQREQTRVARALQLAKWKRVQVWRDGRRVWVYVKQKPVTLVKGGAAADPAKQGRAPGSPVSPLQDSTSSKINNVNLGVMGAAGYVVQAGDVVIPREVNRGA